MTTCAVPGRMHQADVGIHLCRVHFDDLADWLHDVEREHAALSAAPSMAANWGGSRGGTLASHTAPARINVLVHADERRVPAHALTGGAGQDQTLSTFDTLHRWANMIRDGRDIKPAGRWVTEQLAPGPVCRTCEHSSCRWMRYRHFQRDPVTVATERAFLSRHLEWAAAQPWAGNLWAEIRKLRGQLQAVNGTGHLRAGACPQCGGSLSIIEPRYTSGSDVLAARQWVAECDRDVLHRWEGKQLLRLRLEVDERHRSVK